MKRKNNVELNITVEDSSDDDQEIVDLDSESEGDEGDSIVEENALDASATDTDEDESDVDSDFEEDDDVEPKKSKSEKVKEEIFQRYQDRQGKQLYIRFPHKIPETLEALEEKIRELTPLVIKVHKPRQRHVRFCLIDFATKEDRDAALNKLKKSIKIDGVGKYVVNIPRTESTDFVKELAERKIKSIENKKAKKRLKKASKKSLKENNFTSTVIVLNLPKNTSMLQIRELFANAVDINIKPGRGKLNKDESIAAVTFPTTLDARNAVKNKISLGGNQLVVKFDKGINKNNVSKDVSKIDDLSQKSKAVTEQPKLKMPDGGKEKISNDSNRNKKKLKQI